MARGGAEAPRRKGARKLLDKESAWDYLLWLLGRRMYTAAELTRKLEKRGLGAETAEELIARLTELKLIDDASYTDMYVSSREASRGRLGLMQELRRKGVAQEVVEARLEELTPEAQLAAATALLRKNAWRYRPEEGATSDTEARLKARAKAFAFLARRGFTVAAAQDAVAAVGWFDEDGA